MKNVFKVKGKYDLGALIISLIITEGIGFVIGMFISNSTDIYSKLVKPSFAPPGYVFPIVWGIMYALMAIAAYRIYLCGKNGIPIKSALFSYTIQLILNFLWSFIFFKFNLYGLAFLELCLLWLAIVITTVKFYKIDKVSAYLMIPYILWVTFAGVLNFFVWKLNEM